MSRCYELVCAMGRREGGTRAIWWQSARFLHISAALQLAFQGLLRAAETVPKTAASFNIQKHLTWRHVAFVPPTGTPRFAQVMVVPVKQANKGPGRYAQRLPIILPMTDSPVCACRSLLLLRDRRREELQGSMPPLDEPVLRGTDGRPLAYTELLKWLRWLIRYLGDPALKPEAFALHSLRIGGATALLKAGCPPAVIQAMGRWSSEIYQLYTRACLTDSLRWTAEMAKTNVVPTEIAGLLERHNITAPDTGSALEREQETTWAEDGPDD